MVTSSSPQKLTQILATGAATLGLTLVAGVGAANAAVLTQTFTNQADLTDLGSLTEPTTANFTLPQFDPALGTLQTVTLSFERMWGGRGGAENNGITPANLTLSLGADIGMVGPGINDPLASIADVITRAQQSLNSPFAAAAFDGTIDYGGTSGFEDDFPTVTESGPTVTLNALTDDLSAFIGLATLNYALSARSYSIATGSGDINSFFRTFGSGKAAVEYAYEEPEEVIPTPALLPGVIGMGAAAWRKRKGLATPEKA
jgi:hypothetical protein